MSEFGRGYAVCLIQFLFHEPELQRRVDAYAALRAKGRIEFFQETDAVEMWANGAADHLLDIVRPRRWIMRADWLTAKRLSDLIYHAGRQWRGDSEYTEAEMRDALVDAEHLLHVFARAAGRPVPQTFDEAWDLDLAAGFKPERGDSATCEQPINRDKVTA